MRQKRKALFCTAWLVVFTVAICGIVQAQFVEERSAGFGGNFGEYSDKCAGLCFQVKGGGDWPHLTMKNFFDQYSGHNWAEPYAGLLDLGRVRTGSGTASCSLIDRTWCYRHYSAPSMEYYVSRLSPAVLFVTTSQTFDVFAGNKHIGTSYSGVSRPVADTTAVPPYIAYSTSGGVVVQSTSSMVDLSAMNQSWVLFWWADTSWYLRSKIPNAIEGRWGCEIIAYIAGGNQFIPSDMPVLVVFENKPTQVASVDESLRFSFDAGGVGSASIMPLYGQHQPFVSETTSWAGGLPTDVSNRCSTWAARLKYFPRSCTESREVTGGGATVTIRDVFTYLDLADQWTTVAEQIAPIPPAVSLAKNYGFGITLSGTEITQPVNTHSGPYTGLSGTTTVEYTVTGLDKYIDEEIVSPASGDANTLFLAGEVEKEVQKMLAKTDLAPGFSFGRKHTRKYTHFINPGEGILAMAEAWPYLTGPDRTAAASYVVNNYYSKNPLTIDHSNNYVGLRREYFTMLDRTYQESVSSGCTHQWHVNYIDDTERADNIYPLWAFARASGDYSYVQSNYSTMKTLCSSEADKSDWSTCGFFRDVVPEAIWYPTDAGVRRGIPFARGSNRVANGRFSRMVALARIADHQSDASQKDQAVYWLARTAILMAAQWHIPEHLYDAGIQTIEEPADWCLTLSASVGEGDDMILFVDEWADGYDDPRFIWYWDEFGPTLGVHGSWWNVHTVFHNMTPECGRFMADNLKSQIGYQLYAIADNAPAWHEVKRISYIGKENSMDNPQNAFYAYMANAYGMQYDGATMLKYLDIPTFETGDLYQIRRCVANLRCFGGHQWQTIQ